MKSSQFGFKLSKIRFRIVNKKNKKNDVRRRIKTRKHAIYYDAFLRLVKASREKLQSRKIVEVSKDASIIQIVGWISRLSLVICSILFYLISSC